MTIQDRLNIDLKTAMKEKNQAALRAIRAAKTAFMLALTDGTGQEIDEKKEIEIIQKLIKQRQESLDIFMKQMREDLAEKEREELAILEVYLPEQMSEEELDQFIKDVIAQNNAQGMKDMGKVMGVLNNEIAGKADPKIIAAKVKTFLTA